MTPEINARRGYYTELATQRLAPLWESLADLVPDAPRSRCRPELWRYAQLRPFIERAGRLISAAEAERRVLVLENPGYPGGHRVTNTLYAGFQLLLPGEAAAPHRHSQSAMRFVIEGEGAYTAVDGVRHYMHRGDLILTPAWCWHDHANPSDAPMIWLDALDIPIVADLAAGFRENDDEMPRPVEHDAPLRSTAVECAYPYQQARAALESMASRGEIDSCHGVIRPYVNPVNGGSVLPTMSASLQYFRTGIRTQTYRSTASTTFVVVEGAGSTQVGGQRFEWAENDVFVVPSWFPSWHEVERDAVLFSYSDRALQEKLGLWREQRGG
jgi:gentisate 1,2-dioxygenase